jgi:hypothetical protein
MYNNKTIQNDWKGGMNMAKIDVNLDGQRFDRWLVLKTIPKYKNGKTYCLCRCDCGTEKYVVRHLLVSGNSKSCGCLARELTSERCRKDYVGQVFGELTVLEMLYGHKNGKTYCRCLCTCGNECMAYVNNLVAGHTRSCGCKSGTFAWDVRGRSNLIGMIFGRLTVTEMLYGYNGGAQTYCRCICECGTETTVCASNLLKGRTASCGCLEAESRYGRVHHKDITGQHFGHLTALEKAERKGTNGGIIWKCICDCGNITYASYTELILGRKVTCGCSKYSKMELFIHDLLEEYKVPYIPQARFQECRNIFPLPFDFYLYEHNTLIEYDGAQHTRPVDFFGGEEDYQRRVHNDNIKNEYCKERNINLVRLPHTLTTEQIKDIIIHIWNP